MSGSFPCYQLLTALVCLQDLSACLKMGDCSRRLAEKLVPEAVAAVEKRRESERIRGAVTTQRGQTNQLPLKDRRA